MVTLDSIVTLAGWGILLKLLLLFRRMTCILPMPIRDKCEDLHKGFMSFLCYQVSEFAALTWNFWNFGMEKPNHR